jgi:predicted HTH transcriptional regulator
VGCEPSFTISLRMLSLVEQVAALIVRSAEKLALRLRQEQLLKLLRDHGSMTPAELWAALGVSCQGAMDLLRPLLQGGLVEKVGGKKAGRYSLMKP